MSSWTPHPDGLAQVLGLLRDTRNPQLHRDVHQVRLSSYFYPVQFLYITFSIIFQEEKKHDSAMRVHAV